MTELIETEKTYVHELYSIIQVDLFACHFQQCLPLSSIDNDHSNVHQCNRSILFQGYKKEMSNPEMKGLVPHSLHGKADILFGNMEGLYQFHNE